MHDRIATPPAASTAVAHAATSDAAPPDRDLIVAWRYRRDESAFARLAARHAGFCAAVARRQLAGLPGSADLAEDAAQAAMVVLARRPAEAARVASVRGWLHRVVVLTCRAQRRDLGRRHRRERSAAVPERAVPTPERWADEELSRLAARDREVLALRYLDGLPLAQVAARLNLTAPAAKQRSRRALDRLARRLRCRDLLPAAALSALAATAADGATLAPVAATAASAAPLALSPAPGVLTLAQETLTMMKLAAAKSIAATAAAVTLTVGLPAGVVVGVALAQDAPTPVAAPAAVPAIPAPAPEPAPEPATDADTQAARDHSGVNLFQIGQSSFLYSNENRQALPPDLGTLARGETMLPPTYFANPRRGGSVPADVAAADREAQARWIAGNGDYVWVGEGINFGKIGLDRADILIAYERPADLRDGVNVLFATGGVRFLPFAELSAAFDRANAARKSLNLPPLDAPPEATQAALDAAAVANSPYLGLPARVFANAIVSASNLRRTGLGAADYASRHGGAFPPDLASLQRMDPAGPGELFAGTGDLAPADFVNPRDPTPVPPDIAAADRAAQAAWVADHAGYVWVGDGHTTVIGGKQIQAVIKAEILAYEKPAGLSYGVNVLYADGRVDFVKWERLVTVFQLDNAVRRRLGLPAIAVPPEANTVER